MKVYKLTNENMETYNHCKWTLGKWKETSGKGGLCGPGWLHCYSDPLIAVFLKPIHTSFISPRLFIAETKGRGKHDCGLKSGYKKMRLLEEIDITELTSTQRIAFGILCAKEVYKNKEWNEWADQWLSGKDRRLSSSSSYAAAYAAAAADSARYSYVSATACYTATTAAAATACYTATTAAAAAAQACSAAAQACSAAAYTAYTAAAAAYAAEYAAAAYAAAEYEHIDLIRIAHEAMKYSD